MSTIIRKEIDYTGTEPIVVQVTQSIYNKMPERVRMNGNIYAITDAEPEKELMIYSTTPTKVGLTYVDGIWSDVFRVIINMKTPTVPVNGQAASTIIDISDLELFQPLKIKGMGLLGGIWQHIPSHPENNGEHYIKVAIRQDGRTMVVVTNHKAWENSDLTITLDYIKERIGIAYNE